MSTVTASGLQNQSVITLNVKSQVKFSHLFSYAFTQKNNEIAVDQLMIQSGQVSPVERLGSPCPLAPWWFPDMATIQLRPRFPLEKSPTKHKDHL